MRSPRTRTRNARPVVIRRRATPAADRIESGISTFQGGFMSPRETLACAFGAAALLLPTAAPAAEKLDKNAKKWLEEVRPLMLPEEEKVFRELKDSAERDEFQKIFWARRDPDLETPANEYRTEYEKTRADVDNRFRVAGKPGSATDCG